jgi:hypothetical protein
VWRGGEFAGSGLTVGDPVEAAAEAAASSHDNNDGGKQQTNKEANEESSKQGGGGDGASADDRGVYQFNLCHGRLVRQEGLHEMATTSLLLSDSLNLFFLHM